jgi:mycothiol synthase
MPADLVVRTPTEADAEAIARVCNELSGRLYGVSDLAAEEVRFWLTRPDLGTAVAEEGGEVVGYADFRREGGGPRLEIDLRVAPRAWGHGAADALLEAAEGGAAGSRAHVVVSERDEEGRSALDHRGYRLIRHSFLMEIDLPEAAQAPEWPPGFALRAYAGPADEQAVYECQQEAFSDDWEFRPEPLDEWRRFTFERPTFDPGLWWLVEAEPDGALAGFSLNAWHVSGDRTFGWIGSLGVRKAWRRRGLALALLRHSFADFAAHGATRVGLGVDAENTTGAVRLYERAGMHPVRRLDIYERKL